MADDEELVWRIKMNLGRRKIDGRFDNDIMHCEGDRLSLAAVKIACFFLKVSVQMKLDLFDRLVVRNVAGLTVFSNLHPYFNRRRQDPFPSAQGKSQPGVGHKNAPCLLVVSCGSVRTTTR